MKNMNKIILILFSLISLQLQAQVELTFDKRFVECEDKWVAFQMDEDGLYSFGFIYIDTEAGLTLNSEGTFKRLEDGSFELNKLEEGNIKIRLVPNNVQVAIIPKDLFELLEIEETPEWLQHYKTDLNTVERHYKWGYMYNGWNECQKALPFLLKAKAIDPDFEGLIVEIAYSYNCLKEYSKATELLETEIIKKPKDAYINKEYIYSITKTNNIEKAIKQYYKSQKEIKENPYSAENCFNILQFYYNEGDKKKFNKWYKELVKLPVRSDQVKKYADLMKSRM
jgi:tetratricopeptide (TPR) repeat protein